MLILSRDDVRQVLDIQELFEALIDGFKMLADGQWSVPLRTALDMSRYDGVSLFMPAYCEGLGAAGMKLVTVMNDNPQKNLPLIHSEYLYVNAETGEIVSVMDAEYLTAMRTAVTSALVTDCIGKSGGRVLAVFGTGVQAWSHVEVFTKLFAIGEVLVFSRTADAGEKFAVRVERQLRTPARRAVMTELKRAEIICTCTTSALPLFELKDLRSDAHVNAVGAYRAGAREVGSDVVSKAVVIVDSYEGAFNEAGEIVIALQEAAIQRNHIYGSIDEIVSGLKALPDEDKLTLFKSLGLALEDLVAAHLVCRKARERGIGTEVPV
jgi:ornithine cyclodeaminase/alanine dehydrogenase-like protein (mu-crystallin family)